MRNFEIASVFNQIADLLEIQGANPFRIRAYRRAALNIEGLADNVETLSLGGSLDDIPGIGSDLAGKIDEYLRTGRMEFHEQLKKEVPLGLAKMVEIPSVGPKTAKEIYDRFRIETIEDLEALCKTDKLLCVPGFKQKTVDNILRGIELYRRRRGNYLLGRAVPLARELCKYLEGTAERVAFAGSLRRMKEIVHDIDILAASKDPVKTIQVFLTMPDVETVLAQGGTKASIRVQDDMQVDLRVVDPQSWGAAMHYFTGSKAHNIRMRERAIKQGLKLNEYGLFDASEKRLAGAEEGDIFEKLGLPYIPPVLREDWGEMEAAAEGKLPNLVEPEDIRGDLHMHTTWSDGKYSDELLAKLDFVVASLHTGFKQDRATLTARVVRAMQNPYVRVIGHPTGRLLGDRDPYELDFDEVMKEAVRTRTCLEVNSNFHRLDLSDIHCRKAREMGVHVIISTDSHNYDDLLNLPYGVATAQRGWIEKDRVLNARPVEDMLNFKKKFRL